MSLWRPSRSRQILITLFLTLLTLLVYMFSYKGEGRHLNYFVLLADAFLHGRLYLTQSLPWLNELINWHGRYYVVYPPMPAILLMPFVAIFGIDFPQPYLSILVASVNVGLCFVVLSRIFNSEKLAIWTSLLYAFGTIQWYHAQVGSSWYIAHIVAMLFVWLALLESVTKQRLFLIGIFFGLAYLARLPAILGAVFVPVFLFNKFFDWEHKKIKVSGSFSFGFGLAIPVFLNFGYNFIRYGVINDISYNLLPVFHEPWYRYGIFSIRYLPTHLTEVFTALPRISETFPFIIPSISVLALWFVTPAFLLIPFANFRSKLVLACAVAALIAAIPSFTHGSNGFTQFGFRFSLDYTPFLILLVASAAARVKRFLIAQTLIVLSILVNLWGVVMITHLQRFSF